MSEYAAIAKALDLPENSTEGEVFDAIAKLDKSQKRLIGELIRLQQLGPQQWEWASDAVRLDPLGFYRLLRTTDSRLARIWAWTARGASVGHDDVGYLLRLIFQREEEIARAWDHYEARLEAYGDELDAARHLLREFGQVPADADPITFLRAQRAQSGGDRVAPLFADEGSSTTPPGSGPAGVCVSDDTETGR